MGQSRHAPCDTHIILLTGDPIVSSSSPPNQKRNTRSRGISHHIAYPGFTIDGVQFNLGDTVVVESQWSEINVAKILKIFQLDDQMYADIRWFSSIDTVNALEVRSKRLVIDMHRDELMYNMGPKETISLKMIVDKCRVVSKSEFESLFVDRVQTLPPLPPIKTRKAMRSSYQSGRVFFCYRALDTRHGIMKEDLDWSIVERGDELPVMNKTFSSSPPVRGHSTLTIQNEKSSMKHDKNGKSGISYAEGTDAAYSSTSEEDSVSEAESDSSSSEESEESDTQDDETENEENKAPLAKKRRGRTSNARMKRLRALAVPVLRPMGEKRKFNLLPSKSNPKTLANMTAYERARERLYLSYIPDSLPCREDEFAQIYEHLESLIIEGSGSCTYISGVPGTGKTATVLSVMNILQRQMQQGSLASFQFVEINGMKLTDPSQAYQILWEKFTGVRVSAPHAMQLLDKRFSAPSANQQPCVVLMDELDLLLTKNQKVIYNFFEWPNRPYSRLIVVAIANTMDLPERTLSNKVSSRLELKRITFQPYNYEQLVQIVRTRLANFNIFSPNAIELCARKVGSVSGDARRALAICRRAIEIAEETSIDNTNEEITCDIIQKVILEMYSGPAIQAIRKATLHQRIFLVSVFRASRVEGKPEVAFGDVAFEHGRICQMQALAAPTRADLVSLCSFLHSYRLIQCELNKMGDPLQKLRLAVPEEDLTTAMKNIKGMEFLKRILEA